MAEKNPYDFRGFKVYTPELPAAPAAPLYDIVFFWAGIEDETTGLVRCDHYNGLDYTNGEWPYYRGQPKTYVSSIINPNTGGSYITGQTPTENSLAVPLALTITDGFSMGCWIKPYERATYPALEIWNSVSPMQYWGLDYNDGGPYVEFSCYYNGSVQISDYLGCYRGTDLFIQLSVDYTANTAKFFVNGSLAKTATDIATASKFETFSKISMTFYGDPGVTNFGSAMVSLDKDINFYTELFNTTRLCNLTEYPKLAAPTVRTQPTSTSALDGQDISFTGAVNDNGDTATIQWYVNDGGGWDSITGETSFPLTVSATTAKNGYQYRFIATNSEGTATSNAATLTIQDFAYSQETTILHASEPTNQQILFTVNRSDGTSSGQTLYLGASGCKSDYSDVRFLCNGVLLDYWVVPEYTSSTAQIWVKFPSIPDAETTFNVKYGNAEATTNSSGLNTFAKFEDFSGGSLDTEKWTSITGNGVSIATGVCTITDDGANGNGISLIDTFGSNYRMLARVKPKHSNTTSYLEGIQWQTGSSYQVAAYYCHVSGDYNHKYYVYDGSNEVGAAMVGDAADTWLVQEIIRNGATNQIYLIDSANSTILTVADMETAANIRFVAYANGSQIDVDWMAVGKYLATAPTIGEWSTVAEGEILFGTHFDDEDDWDTSQDASLLTDWDQKTADNEGGGTYEAGYIAQHGESSGKCLKQYWDTGTSTAQNCWLIKNSISIPDEFWLGYRFKVDTNWDWGSATSLKIMKLHYDNGTTLDINWCSSHYEMPSPYTPPGGGYSIATDATGKNWFGHWTDIDDGAWHTFVWHFKHSTNTLECFIDSVDAALTSETPAFPGSGWDDGSESGYALSFGGNLSGGGGGVDEMYTKYDDVCIGTTRAKVEEYLGL